MQIQFQTTSSPDYTILKLEIPMGQTILADAGSMVAMDPHIELQTQIRGGMSRFLTGESLFLSRFTAASRAGHLELAPSTFAQIIHLPMSTQGPAVFIQSAAFLASTSNVKVESKYQGIVKSFFSGGNLFLGKVSGDGDLWLSVYGHLVSIDVQGDYVIDSDHVVAFEEGLEYEVRLISTLKRSFFSGEGFVCRFRGQGKVWIQSRKIGAFVGWADKYRITRTSNQ